MAGEAAYGHFVGLFLFQNIDAELPFMLAALLDAFDDFLVLHCLAPFRTSFLQHLNGLLKISVSGSDNSYINRKSFG